MEGSIGTSAPEVEITEKGKHYFELQSRSEKKQISSI